MNTNGETTELRLVIGSDRKIRMESPPDGFKDLEVDPVLKDADDGGLLRATISALVEMARRNRLRREDEYRLLGAYLHFVLLDNDIGRQLHDALMAKDGSGMIRIVLEFEVGIQNLAAWPWEYLYRPGPNGDLGSGYFLHEYAKVVLVRHLPTNAGWHEVSDPPVRVLVVVSAPEEMNLSFERLLEDLEQLAAERSTDIDLRVVRPTEADPDDETRHIPAATYGRFYDTLGTFDPHMVHLFAHGRRRRDRGEIAFMDAARGPRWIEEEQLTRDLTQRARSLRFVLLEACESALAYDNLLHHHAAVSGVAMRLANRGVPAVVGMQYEIAQGDANAFTLGLYRALLERKPVDLAVLEGREALQRLEADRPARRDDEDEESNGRPGFGLPVLYLTNAKALFPPRPATVQSEFGGLPRSTPPPAANRHPAVPPTTLHCVRCDNENPGDVSHCIRCRNYLSCPACNRRVESLDAFCECGVSLERANVPLEPAHGSRRAPPARGPGRWG